MCFVNLHVHSSYSLLDAISRPEDIVQKVKNMGQPAVSLTDHGHCNAAVKLYKLAKEHGVKYIHGEEFYIAPNRRIKDKNEKYYHLTVLAKNEQGRVNINKLTTLANLEGFYFRPRIDFELLEQHRDGLIVLSGCLASEVQRALTAGAIDKARETIMKYHCVFSDDYYLEIQSHSHELQQKNNRILVDIAKELGIKWVTTADSHFVNKEDMELHSIFIQIARDDDTAGDTYLDTQLQSEQEARELLSPSLDKYEIDIAIANTAEIMEKCNIQIPLSAPIIPHVQIPSGFKDENDYLKHLCKQGWLYRRINLLPQDQVKVYLDRLYYEYDAICKMGFAGYYLLVHGYANSVKRRGIARGSGGGSLVAYLINIVDIDPVKYGLYFERFIDTSQLDLLEHGIIKPEELKIPDIDLDFGCEDREKVIQSIVNAYGKDRVASIGTFQYIWDKSAIKDVGRVLGVPFDVTNEITKHLDDMDIEDAIQSGTFRRYQEQYPKLFDYARKITGLPRSFGIHPCGKVVMTRDVEHYTPVTETDGERVLMLDMKDVELLGLVKIDTLGLRTVDVLYDTLEMISKDYDYISPHALSPYNDPNVMDEFARGDTDLLFQFESAGMRSTLKKMANNPVTGEKVPLTLEDLCAVNALYRPGSMKYIDTYIRRKHGVEPIEYLHPDLKDILGVTYGIIIYQEQLITVGKIAGMRNPDTIRKATGKKDAKLMAKVEPELREGLYKRGWTREQVDKLWSDMIEFSRYSFNRSHSMAYAIIAYLCAFLKIKHPREFMTAAFNSYESKGKDPKTGEHPLDKCHREMKRLKVRMANPNWRTATSLSTLSADGEIVLGTTLIKFCNRATATELAKLSGNEYDRFTNFLIDYAENHLKIDTRQMKTLINLGYFNEFGDPQKLLIVFKNFDKRYKAEHTAKTKAKRIPELLEFERATETPKTDTVEQIRFELENYGFIRTTFPELSDQFGIIVDVNTKYTPKIKLYMLKDGTEISMKVKKFHFFDSQGNQNAKLWDIIRVKTTSWHESVRKVGDEWVKTGEKEQYLDACSIVFRSPTVQSETNEDSDEDKTDKKEGGE
jgi:DNA polymerase-3 subunit alpha